MAAANLVAVFVAIFLPMVSGTNWRAAQETARARRIADATMNARLLRLNIRCLPKASPKPLANASSETPT